MKTKIRSKYYEPSGADVYLKYVCPNGDCLDVQWITLKESQTKNYKIVCDCCGEVYRPKRVKKINVVFDEDSVSKAKNTDKPKPQEEKTDTKFLDDAINTLIRFGFDKDEATIMITREWEKTGITNPATLVKLSLDFFGEHNG